MTATAPKPAPVFIRLGDVAIYDFAVSIPREQGWQLFLTLGEVLGIPRDLLLAMIPPGMVTS